MRPIPGELCPEKTFPRMRASRTENASIPAILSEWLSEWPSPGPSSDSLSRHAQNPGKASGKASGTGGVASRVDALKFCSLMDSLVDDSGSLKMPKTGTKSVSAYSDAAPAGERAAYGREGRHDNRCGSGAYDSGHASGHTRRGSCARNGPQRCNAPMYWEHT